jgi:hypothetical protein
MMTRGTQAPVSLLASAAMAAKGLFPFFFFRVEYLSIAPIQGIHALWNAGCNTILLSQFLTGLAINK